MDITIRGKKASVSGPWQDVMLGQNPGYETRIKNMIQYDVIAVETYCELAKAKLDLKDTFLFVH